MNIQLKQAEIIAALRGYIAQQGINLTGKTVDITFTAGRKEGGLTADLIIEDQQPSMGNLPIIEVPITATSIEAAAVEVATTVVETATPEVTEGKAPSLFA